MGDSNPYRPPEADLGTNARPFNLRPAMTVARVLVALWGLFIIAGPSRMGPNPAYHGGQIASKALGAFLFLVAVFPFRKPQARKPGTIEEPSEAL